MFVHSLVELRLMMRLHVQLEEKVEGKQHLLFRTKKKNKECKIKNVQINNECIEKILLQLVGAVIKVGYLVKCIIVILIFFGLTILTNI